MKQLYPSLFSFFIAAFLFACNNNESGSGAAAKDTAAGNDRARPGVTQADWGEADGKKVQWYTLTTKNGQQVKITTYGGIVTHWIVPDKQGNRSSVVLGFDSLQGYLAKPPYFGAIIGRYGNRIARARFTLNGQEYRLAANNGPNHLHGGEKGFDKVVWDATPATDGSASLTLTYLSRDGEEGYPGNLRATVKYQLTDEDGLRITYDAETDKATPVNLTNHSYFNLSGNHAGAILDHVLWIDADRYLPVDSTLIPTGALAPVKGTSFDFTTPTKIGARIQAVPGGYDHNFVLNKPDGTAKLVAYLTDSASGRKLEVFTTEPGLQFYSGNFLDGTIRTSAGQRIVKHGALCLETQHFPDSPNQPSFPSTILQPGKKYHTETRYRLTVAQ